MMFVAWMLAQASAVPVPPPAVATPAAPLTLQAQFEQATATLNAKKWDEAAQDFRAITLRPGVSARTRGVATLREGSALLHLNRDEDAKAAYLKGLQLVGKADPTLNEDRLDALLALGGLEKGAYDYVAARHDFEQALVLAADPTSKLQALLALITVTTFDDNQAAVGYADEAVKIAAAAKVSLEVDASIRDLRGRVLLNRGDFKGALADLEIALKDLGGLTTKTDLNDVTIRADLALGSALAGNTTKAREYLAMTGEGRLPDGPFAIAAKTDLPACGGDLRPEDSAVVEFGIGTDGTVSYANPVYVSRPGAVAREFAQAVSAWSWKANEVSKIPIFYRVLTRVQLRCSTAVERPADLDLLLPEVNAWLKGAVDHDLETPLSGAESATLRAALSDGKDGGLEQKTLVGSLLMLAAAPTTERGESRVLYERASVIAARLNAPPAVTAYINLSARNVGALYGDGWKAYYAAVRDMLARPAVAADARTSAVLQLILGSPQPGGDTAPESEMVLQRVIDDKRLEAGDPLKVGALVRLSSLQAQQGKIDLARMTYLKSGLDAQQCALVDAQPAIQRVGVGSRDYPMDMLMMNVSGWTMIELDVLPSGETTNRRAVISYPPYMFGDQTVKAMARTRYTQSYRPEGALGCGGARVRFRYTVPQT